MPLEGEGELNERRGHTVPKRDNDELNAETRHQTPISRSVYLLYPKSFNSCDCRLLLKVLSLKCVCVGGGGWGGGEGACTNECVNDICKQAISPYMYHSVFSLLSVNQSVNILFYVFSQQRDITQFDYTFS